MITRSICTIHIPYHVTVSIYHFENSCSDIERLGCCDAQTFLPLLCYIIFQIQVIDIDGLLQLPMLSCLDLQNNNISTVPPRLGTVSSLK